MIIGTTTYRKPRNDSKKLYWHQQKNLVTQTSQTEIRNELRGGTAKLRPKNKKEK